MVADHDDRVVPAHSYKFTAQLQYSLGSKLPETPLMIRIDSNSGHGGGKPISKWVWHWFLKVSWCIESSMCFSDPRVYGCHVIPY